MEPAFSIIQSLGGPTKVSAALGVHRSRVWRWGCSKEQGGTDGIVPFNHVPKLISMARDAGIEIDANAFLPREN